MRNLKKLVALMLTAAMVLAPVTTLAANGESDDGATNAGGTINGSGAVEGYVDKDVFKVVLPTVNNVNFTLDPQGLLNVADSSKYASTGGAVYFANAATTGKAAGFSDTSDAITIYNKSSYNVDVTFTVNVTVPEGISLATSKEALADATTPTVWLGVKEAAANAVTTLAEGDNNYTTVEVGGIGESKTEGYYIKAEASGSGHKYSYVLVDNYDLANADNASYTLTGACDTKADWSDIAEADRKLTASVVWSATKHSSETKPSIEVRSYANTGAAIEVTLDFGTGDLAATGIEKITYANSAGNTTVLDSANYTVTGNVLRFKGSYVSSLTASRDFTIVFNDDADTSVVVSITK